MRQFVQLVQGRLLPDDICCSCSNTKYALRAVKEIRTGKRPLEKPLRDFCSLVIVLIRVIAAESETVCADEAPNVLAVCKPMPQGPPANCTVFGGVESAGGCYVPDESICDGHLWTNKHEVTNSLD